MATYDTEEQQVEALKAWWRENARIVIVGALLGFGAVFAVQAWMGYQESRRQAASLAFNQMSLALEQQRSQSLVQQGEHLIATYPDSGYAGLAALLMARVDVDNGDLASAHARLQWVLDNSEQPDIVALARIRLARVLLADGKANLALTALQGESEQAYRAVHEEVKGDVYVALGQHDQARAAYAAALEAMTPADDRSVVQMKLDDLGA